MHQQNPNFVARKGASGSWRSWGKSYGGEIRKRGALIPCINQPNPQVHFPELHTCRTHSKSTEAGEAELVLHPSPVGGLLNKIAILQNTLPGPRASQLSVQNALGTAQNYSTYRQPGKPGRFSRERQGVDVNPKMDQMLLGRPKSLLRFSFCKIKDTVFIFTNNFIDLDILTMSAISRYWLLVGRGQCIRQPHSKELFGRNVSSTKKRHKALLTRSIGHSAFSIHCTSVFFFFFGISVAF